MSLLEAPSGPETDASTPFDTPRDLGREWLLTDGRGGFAASTPGLSATRRYHGLLAATFEGTAQRHLFLSRFDEKLGGDGLSCARYGEEWAPRGDKALVEFTAAPWPRTTYEVGGARLSREVRMLPGERTVLVRYELSGAEDPRELELRPLLPFRETDALTVENDVADTATEELDGAFGWKLYEALPRVLLSANLPLELEADPTWYKGLTYEADEARGFEGASDELSPAVLRATLKSGKPLTVAVTIEEAPADPDALWKRTEAWAKKRGTKTDVGARLERAATQFLYTDEAGRPGVLAGFPWFGEWGRDTFLSLPGLTLARGNVKECEAVLLGALPFLKDGLLPNIFGTDVADSHYGSADAALWFARAALLFDRAGGSRRTVERKLLPALESIAESYLAGTELGLKFDEDGILHAGSPELNPTWMDARTSQGPVTPRHGAPVEIAALGYSLIAYLDESIEGWSGLKRRAKKAFLERFWIEEEGYLADIWRDGERDTAVRPNMVLAAALELSPLTRSKRAAIVARAREELLTPKGLRTLTPAHADYACRYEGGPDERDGAYHQGTVWPWLLGFFTEASLRAGKPTKKLRAQLAADWSGLEPELDNAGLDHVSEVFDGDQPQRPAGCFAQAWNTAEWLRARKMLEEGGAG